MPTNQERKDAIRRWQDHCDNIQRMTIAEQCSEADRQKRIDAVRRNYAKFVAYYFPHYCTDKDTGRNIPEGHTFFKEDGGRKNFTIAMGREWTGGDVFDDYC